MRADPRRIHELEYELDLRDDPPPPQPPSDAPGSVIYYTPSQGTPVWPTHAEPQD